MQKDNGNNEGDYIDRIELVEDEEDSCPFVNDLINFIEFKASTSFLGLPWRRVDTIKKFLKARGYKILERVDDDHNKYYVAVKPDTSAIPDYDNLRSTFLEEAEDLVVDMMIKFSENNGK